MAYTTGELVSAVTTIPASLRIWPTAAMPKTIAAIATAPLLARALPMAWNTSTSKWNVWSNTAGAGAVNIIAGFLMDPVQTHATLDVLGVILLTGEIHRDDIPVPTGESQANLDIALKASKLREKGIILQGLANIIY